MPTNAPLTVDFRDVFYLSPQIVLTFWGLLVLLVDLSLAKRLNPEARRRAIGWLSLSGVAVALVAAVVVCLGPLYVTQFSEKAAEWLSPQTYNYLLDTDPSLFFGTISGDSQVGYFNVLYIFLLGLILYLSMAWSFTEEWGEYFALMFWATVGMMLLTASEELITLFLTLETMTICLYLSTSLEKTKRRSAEAGLKYFVYGSVSSALFLFGLSLLYGLTGTTYFDAIRNLLMESQDRGLANNVAGATAVVLMLVGFGFKVAAVPFHQWAPEAYEGSPAPVTAWIATGSKLASFVALMKVFLHALLPWSNPSTGVMGPGWVGIVAIIAAVTMTYGNFAALAQRNFKRMLAYSSIAHAGYILVGVAAVSISVSGSRAAGAVLYYLIVYAFANVGAFAVAAWLVRDKKTDDIDDLNGLGYQEPILAVCILLLMLSLIGIPPLAGFFAKLYVFMEAIDQSNTTHPITLIWLVALGLFNSVVSAFYYVRVLKAMFLREPGERPLEPAGRPIVLPIAVGTLVVVICGISPDWLLSTMQAAAVPMLSGSVKTQAQEVPKAKPAAKAAAPTAKFGTDYGAMTKKGAMAGGGGASPARGPSTTKKAQPPATKKASDTPAAKAKESSAPGAPSTPAKPGPSAPSKEEPKH
ncbi:MAG: NADH-quinone oxidoreductase subunit N [Isosphaeraceae bacterium]